MAEDKNKSKSNIKTEYNVGVKGLNMDNSQNNIEKGSLSYALNAAMENYDANSFQYQNEPGNEPCFDFPEGYKLIGKHFIPEQNRIIFFLTNPDTGHSEIGHMVDNNCEYATLVSALCLNFDVNHPVLRMVHRITDVGTELYWADNNGRRYIDLEDIPYIPTETSEICDPQDSNLLDCGKLLLQPDINIPLTEVEEVRSGGEITAGTYQFTVQYADANGNPYTSYFNVTNPTPIADVDLATVNFDYPVGKSIVVKISNLDPLGQYKYFNLAVVKTVNAIQSAELIGTYSIDDYQKLVTFTGQIQTNIRLSMNDIYERFAFYDNADYVTAVQDVLVWKGVTIPERINYQKIANQVKLQWQSFRIPNTETYGDEINANKYRGYLRDEVYAFELIFIKKSGQETDRFHLPGRVQGQQELTLPRIEEDHPDFIGTPDIGEKSSPYWKIYNTASVEGTSPEFTPNEDYKGPYQYGDFAYWESTEEYPCDEDVWGDLAGEKIRHHKFPDVGISPIIEGSVFTSSTDLQMENSAIYALGVKIDSAQVEDLIQRSDLTDEQKEDIIGFKIVRADRGVNKSVIAKGMLRNVGKYTKEEQDYYYPNYPYNDLNKDPFLLASNNAWTQLCEEYTVEILSLPTQDNGEKYVEIEFTSCNTYRDEKKKYYETGTFTICSTKTPIFTSIGTYNVMNQSHSGPSPASETAGYIYPSNYDVWRIGWRVTNAAGYRVEWDDVTSGITTYWMCCPSPFGSPTLEVRVLPGTEPRCIDNCERWDKKDKMQITLLEEVRVTTCKSTEQLEIGTDLELARRQIFNSPETSFGQPFLGNILRLESVMYGGGKAHFVEVKDNAKYRLITKEAQEDALRTAEEVAAQTQTFNLEAMFAVYNAQMTIFRNEITKRNFARSFNSIASYNYSAPVPDFEGVKQRNLDIKRYLIPEVLNVGEDDININNWNRETSVYLRTVTDLPFPSDSPQMVDVQDESRFTISEREMCSIPEKEEDISVVSYYGSIKNEFVNQYGQIYSYDIVDTGFVKMFANPELTDDIIWGGDTFIGRFAYKTKVPFFIDNRVNFPDDSDIFYDEIGNIAYPKYWHSSRSILETWQGEYDEKLLLTNFLSYKAHNFDCPNNQALPEGDVDPSVNPNRTFYDGYYYLFAYGVPSFYCESSYNLDLRTAFNNKEGDFWPHVSTGIPDDWVQETNVTIAWDNTYNYNVTFSRQNKEVVGTNLPADWEPEDEIRNLPFRAVYSDPLLNNSTNSINNWLTYRPASYYDFPQNYGNLTALDGLKNSAILARFENKSLLYNNLLTIDTSNPQAAYVGNPNLFENPPIDYADTDQGYMGSQHKFLLKTPYGAVSADAKRGHVFLINGTNVLDLTKFGSGMHRWFTAHLPFEILKYYPNIDIDNHFNGMGLHGVYDSNYERAIITKIDYVPLFEGIEIEDGKWYITENNIKKEIYLTDTDYFCNVSWTISYNFNSGSWISFHSYIPNWYVGENNFFYSGLNYCPNDFDVLVGVIDNSLTTTTTTTIRVLPSTTTTTTTQAPKPNCYFEADAVIPDCELEGFGEFVDAPVGEECKRPSGMNVYNLITGYDLVSPAASIDSTGSQEDACEHLGIYLSLNSDPNYSPIVKDAESLQLELGTTLYDGQTGNDCTVIADGWYFTVSSASTDGTVFEVVGGVMTQIVECNPTGSTTTTTTTTATPTTTFCYIGVYVTDDPVHPLGGVVTYIDENGVQQTQSGIWVESGTVQIEAVQIISAVGVHDIVCP